MSCPSHFRHGNARRVRRAPLAAAVALASVMAALAPSSGCSSEAVSPAPIDAGLPVFCTCEQWYDFQSRCYSMVTFACLTIGIDWGPHDCSACGLPVADAPCDELVACVEADPGSDYWLTRNGPD